MRDALSDGCDDGCVARPLRLGEKLSHIRSSAGFWGSGLAIRGLFNAFLCCDGCGESGEGALERAGWVDRWSL